MQLSLRQFSLPLSAPVETPEGSIDRRDGLLVRVADADRAGVGEASPLPGWTEPLAECVGALEAVGGREVANDPSGVLAALDATPAARHGLALALADLEARRDGQALYRYLGAARRVESVPVNATLGRSDADATAEAAREAVEAGFGCLKVKVGDRPVDEDVRRLAATREAAGPTAAIRADANGAWTPDEARRALDAFAGIGVEYVEQPLPPDDLPGHAALSGGPVGVAVDETLALAGPRAVVVAGAADVLVVKPMALGGLDRARDAVELAARAGLGAVVTTTVDGSVGRLGAVHLAASLDEPAPAGLATARFLADDVAPDPAPIVDGRTRVPQGAGLGVTVPGWSS